MGAPEQLRSRIFAAMYDRMAAVERAFMGERRAALLHPAHGMVVEIGAGTGANLPYYDAGGIEQLILTEPDPHMRSRLKRKIDEGDPQLRMKARVVDGGAESIDLPDASADVVVSTLVLCSVGDLAVATAEAVRVLKPEGQLLFLEHVRSDRMSARRWQDRLTPIQRRIAGGCHLNRDALSAMRDAGMDTGGARHWEMMRLMPIVEGAARKAST